MYNKLNLIITTFYVFIFLTPLTLLEAQTRFSLTLSQSATDDWKQGETKSVEAGFGLEAKKRLQIDTVDVSLRLKIGIGTIYQKKEDNSNGYVLPTDNLFEGEGVIKYPLGWKLDPFFSASFKTQVTESFRMLGSGKTGTAKLWDPVTSQQNWGFAFGWRQEKDVIDSRIAFSLKQVRAYRYTQLTDDRKTPDVKERYKAESGISWNSNWTLKLDSLVTYRSKLNLFGTFEHPDKWTVDFCNEFQFKVWGILGIVFSADFIYDEKACARLQYRQGLRFGIVADGIGI